MRGRLLGALLLFSGPVRAAGPIDDLLRSSAAAYREGRLMDALTLAVSALESDPGNFQAKNYVHAIGLDIRKQRRALTLRPGEKEKSAAQARAYLEFRAARTDEVLRELRRTLNASEGLRSPSGFFGALQGLDKSLGPGFRPEAYGNQAQAYFAGILDNLQKALKKKTFVEAKDRFRAEGYMAYYKGDFRGAAEQWERAFKADPNDRQINSDLESVRELIRREKVRREIEEYVARAEASSDAGLFADAVEAWQEVHKRDPARAGLLQRMSEAKVALEKSRQKARIAQMMAEASGEYKAARYSRAAEIWLDVLQLDSGVQSARSWLKIVGKKLEEETRDSARPASAPPLSRPEAPGSRGGGLPSSLPDAAAQADAEDFYRKGLISYAQGDTAGAVEWLKKSLAKNPRLRRAQQALEQCQTETELVHR